MTEKPKKYDRFAKAIAESPLNQGYKPSLPDQILLGIQLYERQYTEPKDRECKISDAEKWPVVGDLNCSVETVLDNISETIVVNEIEPSGNGSFISNERTGDFYRVPNEEAMDLLDEEISRLFEDLRDQPETATAVTDGGETPLKTVRTVAADALGVEPRLVEQAISDHDDPVDRLDPFDNAVEAIEEDNSVAKGTEYGRMGWRREARKYQVSRVGVSLIKNTDLSDFGS